MKLSDLFERPFDPDPEIRGITADSRAVEPGFLFAAMPGTVIDGAKFIPMAEEKGAAAVLAGPGATARVPLVAADDPRLALARAAARFHGGRQPETLAAITGTNGKTSVASFAAQIWSACGRKAASMGTLGVSGAGFERALRHTTPDPIEVHDVLDALDAHGVTHLALEASSHGLAQRRVDGARVAIAAFTNITRDHLDYHKDFDDYFRAKLRLFTEVLADDGAAVVDVDGPNALAVAESARGAKVLRTGRRGDAVRIAKADPQPEGLACTFEIDGRPFDVPLALVGGFQASNAAVAAGIALASGEGAEAVAGTLAGLKGVRGRMEFAGSAGGGAVYVDYAHTPDAVATALAALRPHAEGRLIALVGAGGDRDREKRPLMGRAAAENADIVIVTDDNPRSEDPAAIRAQVKSGAPDATEIGDRAEAIRAGVALLRPGDVFAVLGKGHETGQTVAGVVLPFDDAGEARAACAERSA
ncbi:MAG: UDP-N-acetylmuramoyl-L-alanyl-D-glutamate--2,6-diaminopimelate ligase [Pseudomonadota bacterium]